MEKGELRVVLVGYNGANNTGSEARLLKVIEDFREVCGPRVHITVPSLNVHNLRRYLQEDERLRIVPIPALYHLTLRRLIKESDLVVLVEGSCYMDTWTSSLLCAYLWGSRFAKRYGRASLAYAIDAGQLKPKNVDRVRKHASKTDLIITRTYNAAQRLKGWGVTSPIIVTADTAFDFDLRPAEGRTGPSGKVGLALVDFHLWPVVVRPFGRRKDRYRWPYHFSRSEERRRAREDLVRGYASLADQAVEGWGKDVVLISMEGLDEPLVLDVRAGMRHQDRCSILSSKELNASQMTQGLRGLDAMLTSRYHAAVLSMAASVPMMAIGHDKRLEDLFEEIGLREELFIPAGRNLDWEEVERRFTIIMEDGERVGAQVRSGLQDQMGRMARNKILLKEFLEERGWCG